MRTKRFVIGMIVGAMVLTMVLGTAWAGKGNALPSGPHYNLNIIGMDKIDKKADIGCGDGHRIFVALTGKSKIMLTEGDDFAVLDCVATSGDPAEFQLPNPDPDNTGVTVYSVYIRLRGKPGGKIKMGTCATDPLTGEEVCSDLQVIEVRETGHGKNKFNNVSKELLYIYAWVCVDYNEVTEMCDEYEYMRVPLFGDEMEDYFWDYDSQGARIAQLRFYPGVETTVPDPLKSIEPSCGDPGDSFTVEVKAYTSKYANFSVGVADVSFGEGITVGTYSTTDDYTLNVPITIAGDADAGTRIVTVTLNDGTELIMPFEVPCP